MSKERFIERQAEVLKAAERLREAVTQPENSIVRDAVIQRFEFTFELVWKSLQLYLQHEGLECGGPRETLKKTFAHGLIASAEEADTWLKMLDDRNLTTHAYDETLASQIYRHVAQDYAPLLTRMAQHLQTLAWD